ncbi:glycosyltransferase family 2 protein [Nocardioides caldifontis]|uniref:glycosyltransferase family 2 protein n=1 Tax=Nocardioides caldifontis TaxID=2588938 RepID=UPI0011E041E1|nr:glycosyltransferase family 2 protein [Nocardioides caldifontis]
MNNVPPKVLVVTPVFNEEENLPDYAETVGRVLLDAPGLDVRVLLVDDGSSDSSWQVIEQLAAQDDRIRGLRLSRNFGSHVALSAGFAHADPDCDAVATLACDLQDPPEVVLEFVERWRDGADIVWGERRTRQDSAWKVWTSRVFNRALERHAMPRGSLFTTGSFLLVDRAVLECFNQFREHNRITFALVAWTGFDQVRVPYDRAARTKGASGWTFAKMMKAMYDAFIGLSTLPLRVMKVAAVGAFLVSLLLALYVLGVVSLQGSQVPGWASQVILVSVFFGVQFSLMAIVGEYLHRIYIESMRRPLYFVSRDTSAPPHPRRG